MQRILITGGTGYIGAHLSQHLAQAGYQVTVLGRFDPSSKYPHWRSLIDEVLIGDITEQATLKKIFERQFEVIIHLVALDYKTVESSPDALTINTLPTWKLLENFSKNQGQRFLYFSTQRVFSELPNSIIDESFPANPNNQHGLSHFLSEQIVSFYNQTTDISAASIRLSNAYGSPVFLENNCWQYLINNLGKMAFEKNEISLLSDGTPLRDCIHVSDICKMTEAILKTETVDNIYHFASGDTFSIFEISCHIQNIYQQRYGIEIPIKLHGKNTNKELLKTHKNLARYKISTQKMESLNTSLKLSIQDGISEIFSYLEKNSTQ